mmetsp:Transcript_39541/g.118351  ORF Transcript_39541/g.118351 Transcript_39541/m.118351 type:complete len:495 (-) Transcript_39541:9-1493(-)
MRDPLLSVVHLLVSVRWLGIGEEEHGRHRLAGIGVLLLLRDARLVLLELPVQTLGPHALPRLGHECLEPRALGIPPLLECLHVVAVRGALRGVAVLLLDALRIGPVVLVGVGVPVHEVLLPLVAVARVVDLGDVLAGIVVEVPLPRGAAARGVWDPLAGIAIHAAARLLLPGGLSQSRQPHCGSSGIRTLGGFGSLLLRDACLVLLELVVQTLPREALERLGNEGLCARHLRVPPLLQSSKRVAIGRAGGRVSELLGNALRVLSVMRVPCGMLVHEVLPPLLLIAHVLDLRDPLAGVVVDIPFWGLCLGRRGRLRACQQKRGTGAGIGVVNALGLFGLEGLLEVLIFFVQGGLCQRLVSLRDVLLDPREVSIAPLLQAAQGPALPGVLGSTCQHNIHLLPLLGVMAVRRRILLHECVLILPPIAGILDLGDPLASIALQVLLGQGALRRQRSRLRCAGCRVCRPASGKECQDSAGAKHACWSGCCVKNLNEKIA